MQAYFRMGEAERVQGRRFFILAVTLIVVVVVQGVALSRMAPLKERIPYFIEVDSSTGEVRASDRVAARFAPDESSIRYHLARWSENLLMVDQHSRDLRLPETAQLLRGDAVEQWSALLKREAPIQKLVDDPEYRQQARVISLAFLPKETALIRLELTDNRRGNRRVQITLSYAIIPPQSEDDVLRNPLGLWITNFGVTDERV
jgi:type IV secretion system protein VirB5